MNESEMIPKKFGIFTLAFTYIGTIIGAGFASGREIWQFFGAFGTCWNYNFCIGIFHGFGDDDVNRQAFEN